MPSRRLLLLASQNDNSNHLKKLDLAAQQLYSALTHPDIGGWLPALEKRGYHETPGLILDPTASEAQVCLKEAFERASDEDSRLLLAFIGHGVAVRDRFYLLLKDSPLQPDSLSAIYLELRILELHNRYPFVNGLICLIDACASGVGAASCFGSWTRGLLSSAEGDGAARSSPSAEQIGPKRFNFLTAATETAAYECCFSQSLALLLNSGIAPGTFNLDPNGKAQLRCGDFVEALTKYCPKQLPTLGGWGDDVLDLAKNVRSTLPSNRAFWEGTSSEPWVRERTDSFVPPAILEECVEASKQHRLVVLVGGAGTGKSSIAAALANPRATSGVVPEAFTHAAAFIEGLNFSAAFAELLSDQLAQSEAAFRERRDLLRAKLSTNELAAAPLEAHVLDPLREIRKIVKAPVRIVIDALDRANHILFKTILDLLHAISTDKNLTHVRVVLTTQPLEGLPQGAKTLKVPIPNDRTLREYMSQQGVPERLHKTILRRARGSWLYVRLLANQVREDPEIRASDLPGSRGQLYARYLDLAGGQDPYRRKHLLRPVLSALSVAGTGPVLPICLLFEAAARLGCKERETAIRDLFSDLRGLLERDQVGTARERVGFFHKTVAEDLRSNALNVLHDESVAHEAMLDAIEQRAPLETLKSCTPLERHELQNRDDCYRYAFEFEMEHLAAAGRWDSLIDSLRFRDSATPAINLKRWSLANGFVADALPEHDERRLTVRLYQADWLRRSSDFREALIRTRQLIRDCRRHLTRKHTLTLAALHLRSECVGERSFSPEDIHRALQLARAVLSRQLDVLGPHHEQVLTTKNDIAVWLGETDRFAEALDHFRALLIEQTKILGPDHTDTLITRYHIAYYTGKNCEPAKAKQLMEALLNDQIRVHGERHPETLDTRYQVAYWNSDLEESLTELNSVLLDRTDVLGPYHADTVGTRREISTRTWLAKDESAGLAMFRSLLEDLDRDLGRDHALTRKMHARCEKLIKALRAGKKALGIDISPPNSLSR